MKWLAIALTEAQPGPALVTDASGAVVCANGPWRSLFGDSTEAAIPSAAAISPPYRQALRDLVESGALPGDDADADPASVMVRLDPAVDGSAWWAATRTVARDDAGSVRGWITTLVPVTGDQGSAPAAWAPQLPLEDAQELDRFGAWGWHVPSGDLWWSEEIYRLLGVPAGTPATYELFLSRVHADDVAPLQRQLDAALAGVDTYDLLHRALGSKDEVRFVRSVGRVVRDAAGQAVRMWGTLRDVHEEVLRDEARDLALGALAESEARYLLLASNIVDVVSTATDDAILTWVSESVEMVLGWRPADLVGRHWRDLVHPDDVEVFKSMSVGGSGSDGREVRIQGADGTWHWMEFRFHREAGPDGQSQWVGAWWLEDARHEARTALAASEESLRMLLENTSDVVYRVDSRGFFTWVSPAVTDALGWDPRELTGTAFRSLVHLDDVAVVEELLRDPESISRSARDVARFRTAGGGHRWMSVLARAERDAAGAVTSSVGALRDVDDLVQARQLAEEQQAQQRAFVDALLDPFVVIEPVHSGDDHRVVDWRIVQANAAAMRAPGYDRVGKPAVGGLMCQLFPGVRENGVEGLYRQCLETGRPVRVDGFRYVSENRGERFYDFSLTRQGPFVAHTWRDVTDRLRAHEQVVASEEHYRLLAEHASDVVWQVGPEDHLVWASESGADVLGWEPADLVGRQVVELVQPDSRVDYVSARAQSRAGTAPVLTVPVLRSDGTYRWMAVTLRPVGPAEDGGCVLALRDVQEEVNVREELQHLSGRDPLTGLVTRDAIMGRITRGIERRARGESLAVLAVGVDGLSQINMAHGYQAGDRVLSVVAAHLVAAVRDADQIARAAGDEFIVVLPELSGEDDALYVAERIRAAASTQVMFFGHRVPVSVSIGIAGSAGSASAEDLVRHATVALRQAEDAGPGRIAVVDPARARQLREHLGLAEEFGHALSAGHVGASFAPVLDAASGQVVAARAHASWRRPDGSMVAPDVFGPAADQVGLRASVDAAVFESFVRAARGLGYPARVGLPVSAAALLDDGFAARLLAALDAAGVPRSTPDLELDHQALLPLDSAAHAVMVELAAQGLSWTVRDFGASFPSLMHLQDLPVSGIVLDPAFTRHACEDDRMLRLAGAVAATASDLGLRTCADGVRSARDAEALARHGWERLSGPWAGAPAADLADALEMGSPASA